MFFDIQFSMKYQKMAEVIFGNFFFICNYVQFSGFFARNRYFWPVSVHFTALKMSPSGARGQITSRTGLITGIFGTSFSSPNLWSGG